MIEILTLALSVVRISMPKAKRGEEGVREKP